MLLMYYSCLPEMLFAFFAGDAGTSAYSSEETGPSRSPVAEPGLFQAGLSGSSFPRGLSRVFLVLGQQFRACDHYERRTDPLENSSSWGRAGDSLSPENGGVRKPEVIWGFVLPPGSHGGNRKQVGSVREQAPAGPSESQPAGCWQSSSPMQGLPGTCPPPHGQGS